MTPDAPPNPPRKVSWKRWIVVLAGVLAIVLAVLFLKAPVPEPVSVRFVRSTNEDGKKKFVFLGTNGSTKRISYFACVAPTAPHESPAFDVAGGTAYRGETFTFSLDEPANGTNWQVTWFFWDPDWEKARWTKARMACGLFLATHHMSAIAQVIVHTPQRHFIPASELKDNHAGTP